MNVHDEWTERLSEFLDGELAADEQRSVEAHLRECADCAAVLTDLRRVVARAQQAGAVPRPPGADLWSGIAARIDDDRRAIPSERAATPSERNAASERRATASERNATPSERNATASERSAKALAERSANVTTFAAKRVSFTLTQLAAAAALVAAVSGGVVWTVVERAATRSRDLVASAPSPSAPATEPSTDGFDTDNRIVPVGMADAQYDAAVSDLEQALKEGRGRLDAATIAVVEHNLQIIDRAIDQAREALAADPANTYLSGHLVEARRRKLDLLRRAAALTSETD
jgi:putative zinc finger protein